MKIWSKCPRHGAHTSGDVLNTFLVINEAFGNACDEIFNPRNAMYISHDNGLFNMDVCIQRDTIINANTLLNLGSDAYTKKQLDNIKRLKEKQEEYVKDVMI